MMGACQLSLILLYVFNAICMIALILRGVINVTSTMLLIIKGGIDVGAGDGNRTHVASLEGWSSTIELHPQPGRP